MPRIYDRGAIRSLLLRDPVWSAYALGDLADPQFADAVWFEPDLTLLYRGFDLGILFAIGTASLEEAVHAAGRAPLALQLRPDALASVERLGTLQSARKMWRMGWPHAPLPSGSTAVRLTAADVPQLERLYADGRDTGESPDFFFPSMVAAGPFYGVFIDGQLAAAAGTHLCEPSEGTAAIGNVYTHRAHRGKGLARQAMIALLRELESVETVALNVRQDNAPAVRLYESLGMVKHCEFYEGLLLPR